MRNVIVSRCRCLRDKQYCNTLKTKAVNIIKALIKQLTLLGLSRKSPDGIMVCNASQQQSYMYKC